MNHIYFAILPDEEGRPVRTNVEHIIMYLPYKGDGALKSVLLLTNGFQQYTTYTVEEVDRALIDAGTSRR